MAPIGPTNLVASERSKDSPERVADAAQQFEALLIAQILRAAQGRPLGEDDGPGEDRETEEKQENARFSRSAALDHFPDIYLKKKGNRRFERQAVS